jgi:hypothetical protein
MRPVLVSVPYLDEVTTLLVNICTYIHAVYTFDRPSQTNHLITFLYFPSVSLSAIDVVLPLVACLSYFIVSPT